MTGDPRQALMKRGRVQSGNTRREFDASFPVQEGGGWRGAGGCPCVTLMIETGAVSHVGSTKIQEDTEKEALRASVYSEGREWNFGSFIINLSPVFEFTRSAS